MQTIRAFIGVEVSPEIHGRAADLVRKLKHAEATIKWVESHNLHLTLKFLGETPTEQIPAVCRALEEAVRGLPPFNIECRTAGAFPHNDKPRTIWLRVEEESGKLLQLHENIEDAMENHGFRREGRRFKPHLTVGRVRTRNPAHFQELGQLLDEHAQFKTAESDVSELIVYSSTLEKSGPIYEPLAYVDLKES